MKYAVMTGFTFCKKTAFSNFLSQHPNLITIGIYKQHEVLQKNIYCSGTTNIWKKGKYNISTAFSLYDISVFSLHTKICTLVLFFFPSSFFHLMDQNKISVIAGTRQALQLPPPIYSDHLSPAHKSEGFVLTVLGDGRAHFKAQTSSRKWKESLKVLGCFKPQITQENSILVNWFILNKATWKKGGWRWRSGCKT